MKKLLLTLIGFVLGVLGMNAQKLYIMGDGAGLTWNEFPGMAVSLGDDGYYTATFTSLNSFKISTNESTGWDSGDNSFNNGAYQLAGGSFGDAVYGGGQTLSLAKGSDKNIDTPWDGVYTLKVKGDMSTITLSTTTPKPLNAPEAYLVGGMTNWGINSNYKMNVTSDGSNYVYTLDCTIPANQQFKIAGPNDSGDVNWGGPINYGTGNTISAAQLNGSNLKIYYSGGDSQLAAAFTGTVTLTIPQTAKQDGTISFTPKQEVIYPSKMYLVGETGSTTWNPTQGIPMTVDSNGVYSIQNVRVTGNFAFVVNLATSDGDWDTFNSERYGPATDNTTAKVGENPVDGMGNVAWKIPAAGNYNMTLDLVKSILTIENATEDNTPDALYLIGTTEEDGTWNIASPIAMNSGDNDSFTVSNVAVYPAEGGEYGYFGLTSVNGGDWGAINADRYGPATDQTVAVASNPFVITGSNSWKIQPAIYNFTVIFGDQNVVNVEKVSDLPTEPSFPEYLQIAFNPAATGATNAGGVVMNPDTDAKLEMIEDGVYQVLGLEIPRQKAFYFYTVSGDNTTKYTSNGQYAFACNYISFPGNETSWPNANTEEGDYDVTINGVSGWYISSYPGAVTTGTMKFDVTVNLNDMTIQVVDANASEPEPELPTTLYLMGWGEGESVTVREPMSVSSTDDHVFEYTYNVPNTAEGFKFYFSTTGSVESKNNYIPVANNTTISFDSDKKYTATWSDNGMGQAIDRVAGETVFRFNVETLECEVEYAGNFVNFEFTGVENAYYYVNMANLTGDDMVVYLYGSSVQYGIDKSGLTQLVASPKDGYTLEITCPEAQSTSTYMITQGGQGDEQVISLYPDAQGYTFTFTVSEKVESEPVYVLSGGIFPDNSNSMEMTLDGTTASAFAVCWPQQFNIQKKVGDEVVATYYAQPAVPGNQFTFFGGIQGTESGSTNWELSAVVVNTGVGSPLEFSFDTKTLMLTVSTGITADAGSDETEQSGSVEDNKTINIVSENTAVLVFLDVPEEATAVYYKVNYNQPAGKNAHRVAPEGYTDAIVYQGEGPDEGRYAASLLTGTTGTLDVIYEVGNAQSKPQSYSFTVTKDVPTGVDGIAADEEGAEYFTLDGVKVKNPEKGIYIRVKNGEVTKVVK